MMPLGPVGFEGEPDGNITLRGWGESCSDVML
jgi:hypothetical protein